MSELNFRSPSANELECKTTVNNTNIEISIYCRAETCTKILNETVGPMNWEKEYSNNNRNCIVRIWDNDKKMWVAKEDCGGGPTDLDGLKGQASNGFKRVCALGWGLGIELYSQPQIKIPVSDKNSTIDKAGNPIVTEKYDVAEVEFENKEIVHLVIKDSSGKIVYPYEEVTQDEVNADEPIPDFLPDNTDSFEEPDEDRFEKYMEIINDEIKRTHASKAGVLKFLQIDSFDKLEDADEQVILQTIEKLHGMNTYIKKAQ